MATKEEATTSTKVRLADTQCPFTWNLLQACLQHKGSRSVTNDEEEYNEQSDDGCLSVLKFVTLLTQSFENVMSNSIPESKKRLDEAETILTDLKTKLTDAKIKVLCHIFYATKCHYLYETYDTDELEDILKNISNYRRFTPEEMSFLHGCESIAWSTCHDYGMEKAMDLSTRALQLNEECPLWHFILAKNMRRKRRAMHIHSSCSPEEKEHFQIAYNKSKNPLFGIYYAQACRESLYVRKLPRGQNNVSNQNIREAEERKVLDIFKEILAMKPASSGVYLKLALGFLRVSEIDLSELVKMSLDEAEKRNPEKGTFYHYKGLFYQQIGEFKEALEAFKEAASYNNFAAELSYVQYAWETNEDLLDPVAYTLTMLKKYENAIPERKQTMLLNAAVGFYILRKDLRNAADYFLKAININPESKKLKTFYRFLSFNTHLYPNGIYGFLQREFLAKTDVSDIQEAAFRGTCKRIKDFCQIQQDAYMNRTARKFRTWHI